MDVMITLYFSGTREQVKGLIDQFATRWTVWVDLRDIEYTDADDRAYEKAEGTFAVEYHGRRRDGHREIIAFLDEHDDPNNPTIVGGDIFRQEMGPDAA